MEHVGKAEELGHGAGIPDEFLSKEVKSVIDAIEKYEGYLPDFGNKSTLEYFPPVKDVNFFFSVLLIDCFDIMLNKNWTGGKCIK